MRFRNSAPRPRENAGRVRLCSFTYVVPTQFDCLSFYVGIRMSPERKSTIDVKFHPHLVEYSD